ncbi:MAG: PQQ-binding-like beta-propeller repeat protein [Bryobacterales bacterium]|nr:PQQ-binding-like beta-propeller repeat protein [Bryobacterales bacterium]
MRRLNVAVFLIGMLPAAAFAQFGREWTTSGNDAQRSNWLRTDAKIAPNTLQKAGFAHLWKMKFNNAAKQFNALTQAMIMDRLIGYKGFRALVFLSGSSDQVIVADSDLARPEWQVTLPGGSAQAGSATCPGALTSGVTRPTTLSIAPPPSAAGATGFGGRGGPAKSGVGAPGEGAVTLAARNAPRPAPPTPARPNRPAARPPGGFGAPSVIYAVSSTGMLHELNTQNGAAVHPPTRFLPANANAHGLIMIDDTFYIATDGNCNGVPDGVWALEIGSKKVTNWKSPKGVAGNVGPALGPDGTLYVATRGGELVSLAAETLSQKSAYNAGQPFSSSPIVFEDKGKLMVAATTTDGRLHVADAATMSAVAKSNPDSKAANYNSGALASWQDPSGTRWILVPTASSVTAWKLNGANLEIGWTSRDLVSAMTPVVMNGVVFAVSSGFKGNARNSQPAVLYALDGITGKELWSSGAAMTSFATTGGLTGGASQLYLSTYDGTLHAFGIPIEH